jgi:hypothetical protein
MLTRAISFVLDPTLPSQILVTTSALAVVIIVTGVGIWSILGAWKVFKRLISA